MYAIRHSVELLMLASGFLIMVHVLDLLLTHAVAAEPVCECGAGALHADRK
jgi:hypothetical protein